MTSAVLDPAFEFQRLRQLFESQRWRLVSAAQQPILPGEPEHATFEREASERATYTFNPVCKLRVIEFSREPDAPTRAALPHVGASDIEQWLASADERTLLRGVLAARLAPNDRLMKRVGSLTTHPTAAIARAASYTRESVGSTSPNERDARSAALAAIEVLKAQVQPLLLALARDLDGTIAAGLRPRPEDYARVFRADVVEAARTAYESIWAESPHIAVSASDVRIECHIAPAGMLASDNELSWHFPGGYRQIAHLLNPHRTWIRWKYLRAGESAGVSHDGLVWCDDHWAWFPKPYRVLSAVTT